jgi:hypothetical protein
LRPLIAVRGASRRFHYRTAYTERVGGGGGGGGGESDDHRYACLLIRDYLMAGKCLVVEATCPRLAHTFLTSEIRLPEGGTVEVNTDVGGIRPDVVVKGPDGTVVWAFEVMHTSATTRNRPFGWSEHTVEAIKEAVPVTEGATGLPSCIRLKCVRRMHYTNGVAGLECARPRCPGCVKQDVERRVADDDAICGFLSAVTRAPHDPSDDGDWPRTRSDMWLARNWAEEVVRLSVPDVAPVPALGDGVTSCPSARGLKSRLNSQATELLHEAHVSHGYGRAAGAKYVKHVALAVVDWIKPLAFRFQETKRVSLAEVEDSVARWRTEPLGGDAFAARTLGDGFVIPKRKAVLEAAKKRCTEVVTWVRKVEREVESERKAEREEERAGAERVAQAHKRLREVSGFGKRFSRNTRRFGHAACACGHCWHCWQAC